MYPSFFKVLPIYEHLDEIAQNLKESPSRFLVLKAETAAGKSTAVPFSLLKHFKKKIVMLEPRRLAVFSIAQRLSSLLNEPVGKTVGYRVHLERSISKETRLEVLTEAILIRKMQNDPSLDDISVVVLDEFHERSIHADLALAFLREAMALRDDLWVLVMSATIDTQKIASYLSCPTLFIKGRQYPVTVEYNDFKKNAVQSVFGVKDTLCDRIFSAIMHELSLSYEKDHILVFLPGIKEIRSTQRLLSCGAVENVYVLHSSISLDEQKKVLNLRSSKIEGSRAIILSSSIAETSLTVPFVRVVIDSGLSRINRFDIKTGMNRLVTERESLFSALQRSGRAGRLSEGKCVCLWSEHERLLPSIDPEILRTELTSVVLECALWGIRKKSDLEWLDEPSDQSWQASIDILIEMNCLKNDEKKGFFITSLGKDVLQLGIHPRLAVTALFGGLSWVSNYGGFEGKNERELEKRLENTSFYSFQRQSLGVWSLLEGFPDRIARLCVSDDDSTLYQFPSGRKARLKKCITDAPLFILAIEVDAGKSEGVIYSYEILVYDSSDKNFNHLFLWLKKRSHSQSRVEFIETKAGDRKIKKTTELLYKKLVIEEKKGIPDSFDASKAWCFEITKKSNKLSSPFDIEKILPWSKACKDFLVRSFFYYTQKDQKEKLTSLINNPQKWLAPFIPLDGNLTSKDVLDALRYFLDGRLIDSNVPVEIILENGRKGKIFYEVQDSSFGAIPVLEMVIQHLFGCTSIKPIMGVDVLIRLLSPARRPLQLTRDLSCFWDTTWPQICKEMKGRYPKHNWDYKNNTT